MIRQANLLWVTPASRRNNFHWYKMVIYYRELQTTDKLIFNMTRGGNLPLETPGFRQTNFQHDQRGSKCWWHQWFKGPMKSCFAHYFFVVIILFTTDLWWSSFSTISFGKLVFCLSVFSAIFVLNQMLWIKTLKYLLSLFKKGSIYYVILFPFYKNSSNKYQTI